MFILKFTLHIAQYCWPEANASCCAGIQETEAISRLEYKPGLSGQPLEVIEAGVAIVVNYRLCRLRYSVVAQSPPVGCPRLPRRS